MIQGHDKKWKVRNDSKIGDGSSDQAFNSLGVPGSMVLQEGSKYYFRYLY